MANCVMDETMTNALSLTADIIRRMYPAVDENITPLPRQWSSKDKSSILGLSQNNLMVHYKGLFYFCDCTHFYLTEDSKCFFVGGAGEVAVTVSTSLYMCGSGLGLGIG